LTPANRRLKTDAISHSTINSRCSELLARSELGEPLSEQNRVFLLKECQ
jgi:hypothetical protein